MDHLKTRDRIAFAQYYDGVPIESASERIRIQGRVTISQGDGEKKEIIIDRAHNKWVKGGLKGLLSHFVLSDWVSDRQRGLSANALSIYLGTDTTTATTHDLTTLKTPIGTSPGTDANTKTGEGLTTISDGHHRIAYTAIFNPGTVSGTVGEVALYLGMPQDLTKYGVVDASFTQVMVSRCSVADGDFSSFVIDTSKSLVISWEVFIAYE